MILHVHRLEMTDKLNMAYTAGNHCKGNQSNDRQKRFGKFWHWSLISFFAKLAKAISDFVDHNEILVFANFSFHIAPDCILEYLNFHNFLGEHAPGTGSHSFSCPSARVNRRWILHTNFQLYPTRSSSDPTNEKSWRRPCLRSATWIGRTTRFILAVSAEHHK